MLVQPSRTATVCEVDRARKRAASCNRAQNLGYRTNKLEICHCRSEPILLTPNSSCEACSGFTHVTPGPLAGLEIDDQFDLRRLHDRQVGLSPLRIRPA